MDHYPNTSGDLTREEYGHVKADSQGKHHAKTEAMIETIQLLVKECQD